MIIPSLHKISSKEQMVNRVNESKDVDKKIRRMLTADFSKGSVYHQESNESIYTEKHHMDNFKKQVDLLSHLQPELIIKKKVKQQDGTLITSRSMSMDRLNTLGNQTNDTKKDPKKNAPSKKKEYRDLLQELDLTYFSKNKPTNPQDYIDNAT